MTTLHAIPVHPVCLCHWPEPEERVTMPGCPVHPMPVPPPEPEPPAYRCPNENCLDRDSGSWFRTETGQYAATIRYRFRNDEHRIDGDWDDEDHTANDTGDFRCWFCDTTATPEIDEWIREHIW